MYGPTAVLQLRGEPPTANASGAAVEKTVLDNPQVVLIAKALGPLIGTVLLLLWWVCFSRASWKARLIGPVVLAAVGWISMKLMHPTMNLGFLLYAVPTATTAALVALFLFRDTPFAASRSHRAVCRRVRLRFMDTGTNGRSRQRSERGIELALGKDLRADVPRRTRRHRNKSSLHPCRKVSRSLVPTGRSFEGLGAMAA